MKAKELIDLLTSDPKLAEVSGTFKYENDENGNTNHELIVREFGKTVNILGTLTDGMCYVYQFSDECDSTFRKMPDVIVILQHEGEGMCVFLYAIE